ncbi:MAG: hypothetical protein ACRC2T_03675, partial [Thermoguttaceae bacterium]
VWAASLDTLQAVGTFENVPLASVLGVLARRGGGSVSEVGGVFYVGEVKREDRAFAVLRIPPVDSSTLLEGIKSSISTDGSVSIIGSSVWICDNLESLRKVVSAIESIRNRSEKSYVAEVYFIRVNESHFVNLTAQLQINQIDVFKNGFNMSELFSMFLDADGGTGWAKISQRPVLYLSEGRKVVFSDGREITKEKKSMNEKGVTETTGYSKFSDGLEITMLLNRVSDLSYAVDIDLSISVFDKADKNQIPASDKSSLKSEGLLVRDSQVYYIGSLRRDNRADKAGLFSATFNKSHDMITIWLRVREVSPNQ